MPEKFHCLIVDDEPLARKKMRRFLQDYRLEMLISEASNGVEAIEKIESGQPDLVLLDIQMPGMTGLELLEALDAEVVPMIVFTTAYDQYAVQAFENEAVDYLLKPFDYDRFRQAMDRVIRRKTLSKSDYLHQLQTTARDSVPQRFLDRMMIRENGRILPVRVDAVLWLEADDKYVRIHTSDRQYYVRNTISYLENRLDPERFIRTHRSAIVNFDWVDVFEPIAHGDYHIRMKNGSSVPLSRRYSRGIREKLIG